jgi:hypothetical protein
MCLRLQRAHVNICVWSLAVLCTCNRPPALLVLVLLLLLLSRCARTLGKVQANSIESILAEQEYRLDAFAAPGSSKDTRCVAYFMVQNTNACFHMQHGPA